jgi:hypothetical protein
MTRHPLNSGQVGQESNLQPAVLETEAARLDQSRAVSMSHEIRTIIAELAQSVSISLAFLLSKLLSNLWHEAYRAPLVLALAV